MIKTIIFSCELLVSITICHSLDATKRNLFFKNKKYQLRTPVHQHRGGKKEENYLTYMDEQKLYAKIENSDGIGMGVTCIEIHAHDQQHLFQNKES